MRRFDYKTIVFFVAPTVLLTIGVIAFYEATLRPPFFAWVDRRYPGEANVQRRWDIKQRVEHVVISFTVDALVVTLLLRVVHRQPRVRRRLRLRRRPRMRRVRSRRKRRHRSLTTIPTFPRLRKSLRRRRSTLQTSN